jgi:hypothetical protein
VRGRPRVDVKTKELKGPQKTVVDILVERSAAIPRCEETRTSTDNGQRASSADIHEGATA